MNFLGILFLVFEESQNLDPHLSSLHKSQIHESEMSFVAQGKRNVTTDGSIQLPAQCLANFWMDFSEKLPTGVVGKLGVQNVFGNQWWYLPYLPAPKFQVQIQIQYHFYE